MLGGGLLGLEAAKAVHDLGLSTHVVEFAPRLMPRQLDAAGGRLLQKSVEALGVKVPLSRAATSILGDERAEGLDVQGRRDARVRPDRHLGRYSSARRAGARGGSALGERGGILVDDHLRTSDQDIFAIGECALHQGTLYGLVAPGYQMAEVCARTLTGTDAKFAATDQSAKLKLLGTDVASFGDPFAEANGERTISYEDLVKGVYKKLVVSADRTRLVGGILVGDAAEYATLTQLCPQQRAAAGRARRAAVRRSRRQEPSSRCRTARKSARATTSARAQVCKAVRSGICNLSDLKKAHQGRHRLRRLHGAGDRRLERGAGRGRQGRQERAVRALRVQPPRAVPNRARQEAAHVQGAARRRTAKATAARSASRPSRRFWPACTTT